jgi:hypothetical protein
LFPDTTRCPEKWEDVFAVLFTEAEMEKRRDILDSLWKINKGGQSSLFLQEVLNKIDNRISVTENIPVGNPRDNNAVIMAVCDNEIMCCDNGKAVCEYRIGDDTFTPAVLQNDVSEIYSIPNDYRYWGVCFFIGGTVFRNSLKEILYVEKLKIESRWKNYIEYIILKIKPVHTTAVLFIEWI